MTTTTLELDGPDLEELLLVMSRDPRPVAAEPRDALLRAYRGLEDRPAGHRVTVELDPAERDVLLEDMTADHPLRPVVEATPAVDELKRARAGRDRDTALDSLAGRAAAMEADDAVRRALELGLSRDVRQLVDDALASTRRSDT